MKSKSGLLHLMFMFSVVYPQVVNRVNTQIFRRCEVTVVAFVTPIKHAQFLYISWIRFHYLKLFKSAVGFVKSNMQ